MGQVPLGLQRRSGLTDADASPDFGLAVVARPISRGECGILPPWQNGRPAQVMVLFRVITTADHSATRPAPLGIPAQCSTPLPFVYECTYTESRTYLLPTVALPTGDWASFWPAVARDLLRCQ